MIYTVECSFTDSAFEPEWNAFYSSSKLPALISVPGFLTSQRFQARTSGCPVYLAVHTITGADVLVSDAYHSNGGGNFARWQQYITDWHRNVYDMDGLAPSVDNDQSLVLSHTGPEFLHELGLIPLEMHAIALERQPLHRWMARIDNRNAEPGEFPPSVQLYSPIGPQLMSFRPS